MGVPYARKYHEPGTDDFKSPLFLDCCALVRRGQHDLQEEFGFRLGRWNQAYQYDTLAKLGSCKRITVRASGDETEDDPMPAGVRPGDLVFIEGVYTNPKKRQQVHCITHVEVCLGTGEFGEETLGARWQKGQVQVHPSFRFASSSYTIKAFHFCSIDAWLDGVCKSHCKEHEWRDDRVTWQPGATSVFAAADSDDEDEALPGDDSKEHDAEFSAKSGEAADGANAATSTRSERGVETPRFFVNKSNGWDMVVDALRRRGWSQLPFKNNFSNAFELKWVERRSQIDFGAFREGEQLVNHIPNNDVMTSKSNLISLLADLSSDGEDVSFFPQSYRLDIAADRLRFFKDRIDAAASAANGAAASATLSADENFAVEMSFLLDAADATGKSHLDKILETSGNGREGGSDASVEAPDLDSPDGALCTDGYWICKPSSSNRGRGIHVVRDLRSLYRDIMRSAPEHDEGKGGSGIDRWLPSAASIGRNDDVGDMIIQRYIHTPLLLEGNRKFDIRVYALIARTAPTMLVYYHQGYVRLSLEGYTMDDDRLDDRFVHLTNAAVQKKHAEYVAVRCLWGICCLWGTRCLSCSFISHDYTNRLLCI